MQTTALITGASSGLGFDFAHEFARDGHDVVLLARSKDKLETLAKKLRETYKIQAFVLVKDLSKQEELDSIFPELASQGIAIEFLVNNAGFGFNGAFSDLSWADQDALLDVNVKALTQLTHQFLPAMIKRKSGKILLISSTAAFQPGPFMALYYASKAYVLSFGEAISKELQGTGVSVTILCPGLTQTEFFTRANMNGMRLLKAGQMQASQEVTAFGYRKMMKGKRTVIPGFMNKFGVYAGRFVPKGILLRIVSLLHKHIS